MAYISLLSNIGENLAARLRTSLFSSLLRQDIEFLDRHKTGELIIPVFLHIYRVD